MGNSFVEEYINNMQCAVGAILINPELGSPYRACGRLIVLELQSGSSYRSIFLKNVNEDMAAS